MSYEYIPVLTLTILSIVNKSSLSRYARQTIKISKLILV